MDPGTLWDWLPPGALRHDPDAYLKSYNETAAGEVRVELPPMTKTEKYFAVYQPVYARREKKYSPHRASDSGKREPIRRGDPHPT